MKYYCEYTKKLYDTLADCENAEKEFIAEQNKKANAENEAKAVLDSLMQTFNDKNEAVKKANTELSAASKALTNAVNDFNRKYGYVPDKYRSIQFLSWLI